MGEQVYVQQYPSGHQLATPDNPLKVLEQG